MGGWFSPHGSLPPAFGGLVYDPRGGFWVWFMTLWALGFGLGPSVLGLGLWLLRFSFFNEF